MKLESWAAPILAICLAVAGSEALTAQRAAASRTPRTPDGRPDLQGVWDFRTLTPLERPRELADKATLTAEEAAAFEQSQIARQNKDNRSSQARQDVESAYNDFWWDYGSKVIGTRRTSLIVDPPDGRMPPMTPEAQKRATGPGCRRSPSASSLARSSTGRSIWACRSAASSASAPDRRSCRTRTTTTCRSCRPATTWSST